MASSDASRHPASGMSPAFSSKNCLSDSLAALLPTKWMLRMPMSRRECCDLPDRPHAAVGGFGHYQHRVHGFGRSAPQMLDPCVKVEKDHFVPLEHDMPHQLFEQRACRADAARSAFLYGAQKQQAYVAVGYGEALRQIGDIRD